MLICWLFKLYISVLHSRLQTTLKEYQVPVDAVEEEMIEAQLDEETIDDEIAVKLIEVSEADEQVDKKDELDEYLEYSEKDDDINVIACKKSMWWYFKQYTTPPFTSFISFMAKK